MSIEIKDLYDLSQTLAGPDLSGYTYPWEALGDIKDIILRIGASLPAEEYDCPKPNVWIAKDANVFDSAFISAPCIIGHRTEVRHCAFIRGNALVGDDCVVGNSVELKNVILFNRVQVPHFNYVGDSILGYHSHMGAGAVTSNVKADHSDIFIKDQDRIHATGRHKVGAMLGDHAEVGCNAVLNPGTILGRGTRVYPTSCVRGVIPEGHIYKSKNEIIEIN